MFNSIWDCQQLITERLIDYIRTSVTHAGGITHLRSAKCTPLHMEPDGSIRTINPYGA